MLLVGGEVARGRFILVNETHGWTITIGPSLMGVANNLNDVIQMKCIYLDPVWCMMRLTIGFVEQSLVDYRGASGEAF